MYKDFKKWHSQKEYIHYQPIESGLYFKEGDIWWARLGANVGFEQDGKGESFSRPVLIIKKFNQHVFWAIPLSSKIKDNPYYMECKSMDGRVRSAIISQIKLVSVKRLTDKMSHVESRYLEEIKKAIKGLL